MHTERKIKETASITDLNSAEALPLRAARLALALDDRIAQFAASSSGQDLGHLETQVAGEAQEILRTATETAAQAGAGAHGHCARHSIKSGHHAAALRTGEGQNGDGRRGVRFLAPSDDAAPSGDAPAPGSTTFANFAVSLMKTSGTT